MEVFAFKQFALRQDNCGMKVTTDAVMLGAWAEAPEGPSRILDIGTGTGLLAMMMAQRYPEARVVGIEVESDAARQAQDNAARSVFADRVTIVEGDVKEYEPEELFDAIVCNPPYYQEEASKISPNRKRKLARQTHTLDFDQLFTAARRLLRSQSSLLSVVIPTDAYGHMVGEAIIHGFHIERIVHLHFSKKKKSKRCLIEFRQSVDSKCITERHLIESPWYYQLVNDFYLVSPKPEDIQEDVIIDKPNVYTKHNYDEPTEPSAEQHADDQHPAA